MSGLMNWVNWKFSLCSRRRKEVGTKKRGEFKQQSPFIFPHRGVCIMKRLSSETKSKVSSLFRSRCSLLIFLFIWIFWGNKKVSSTLLPFSSLCSFFSMSSWHEVSIILSTHVALQGRQKKLKAANFYFISFFIS